MNKQTDTFRTKSIASDGITLGIDSKIKHLADNHIAYVQRLQADPVRTPGSVALETAKSGKGATVKAVKMLEKIIVPLRFQHDKFKDELEKKIEIGGPVDYMKLQGWIPVLQGMSPSKVIEMIDAGESELGRAVFNMPVLRMADAWQNDSTKNLLLESTAKQVIGVERYEVYQTDFGTLKTAEKLNASLLEEQARYEREEQDIKKQTVENYKDEPALASA